MDLQPDNGSAAATFHGTVTVKGGSYPQVLLKRQGVQIQNELSIEGWIQQGIVRTRVIGHYCTFDITWQKR